MQLARQHTCLRQTVSSSTHTRPVPSFRRSGRFAAAAAENEVKASSSSSSSSSPGPDGSKSQAEITTEKFGLEAGLYQVLTSKEEAAPISRTEQAKRLLAQYGSAYLLTSISFAIVSFAACYAAVSAGVDVAGLLAKIGLSVNDTSEKVGTFAIAYAAHKALSPVRFPPTVALTPVVARWTGKVKPQEAAPPAEGSSSNGNNGNGNGKQ